MSNNDQEAPNPFLPYIYSFTKPPQFPASMLAASQLAALRNDMPNPSFRDLFLTPAIYSSNKGVEQKGKGFEANEGKGWLKGFVVESGCF
jgi:hypothetical protein